MTASLFLEQISGSWTQVIFLFCFWHTFPACLSSNLISNLWVEFTSEYIIGFLQFEWFETYVSFSIQRGLFYDRETFSDIQPVYTDMETSCLSYVHWTL